MTTLSRKSVPSANNIPSESCPVLAEKLSEHFAAWRACENIHKYHCKRKRCVWDVPLPNGDLLISGLRVQRYKRTVPRRENRCNRPFLTLDTNTCQLHCYFLVPEPLVLPFRQGRADSYCIQHVIDFCLWEISLLVPHPIRHLPSRIVSGSLIHPIFCGLDNSQLSLPNGTVLR